MGMMSCVESAAAAAAIWLCSALTFVNALDIYVSQENGVYNSSCWTGGLNVKCSSLALGLEGLQLYNHSTLWLECGNYSLSEEVNNGNYRFVWMTGIAIQSMTFSNSNSTDLPLTATVQCYKGFGLSFIHVTNITLRGIRFEGCGTLQNTTSKVPEGSTFEKAIFTLYFLYCTSVTMQEIIVQNTPGTGMVMYGTVGNNEITNCHFLSNYVREGSSGGGGFYIEFPYCVPEQNSDCSDSTNVPLRFITDSVYTITNCVFLYNTARVSDNEDYTFIWPHRQTHLAFGRGGGLSIFYKGNCSNNLILVSNCNFTSNTALWGGGLYVEHQDNSSRNNFTLESSVFVGNEVLYKSDQSKGTGGGAVRLDYVFFGNAHASNNSMKFTDAIFHQNKAYFGGGLSFITPKEPGSVTNLLHFQNCTWTSNVARVGSAVDLALLHATHSFAVMQPTFTNCTFKDNNGSYLPVHELGSYVLGVGAFYSNSIPVRFTGYVKFDSNKQSALACIGTSISFDSGCEAVFENNSGMNGGAISLMGLASLEVSRETKLRFINNSAAVKGGAIYGASVGNHDLISSRNCFIRYYDLEVTPAYWNSTFVFEGNVANSKTNSIYATSLLSCLWGGAYGSTKEEVGQVFCWNSSDTNSSQWIYSTNCSNEILTSPATFNIPNGTVDNGTLDNETIKVFPGISKHLPFYTSDDRAHNVTDLTVMTADIVGAINRSVAYIDSSSLYISDNTVKLHGKPNNTVEVNLKTTSHRVISYSFQVEFSECPLGMKFDSSSTFNLECKCDYDMYGSLVICNYHRSKLLRGAWLGKRNSTSNEYVAGLSPYTFALTGEQMFTLPLDYEDMCKQINRTGVLCGRCLLNFGPIFSGGDRLDCIDCPTSVTKYHWVFYLLTEFFPILVFFLIVVLFNISATSGPANSFVFFAQVLTTVCNIDGDGTIQLNNITTHAHTLKSFYVIPYDIWNQKFFQTVLPRFCISPNITPLQVITAGYLTALFPLLLVIIFSLLVWAYGKGFRPIVCLCRPLHTFFSRFRSVWNLQDSITHALATFILVSYSRFTLVSFLLLTHVPLYNDTSSVSSRVLYFDGTIEYLGIDHIPYFVASVLVLSTFVAIPPLLLIGPSVILMIKKIIGKFYKSFQVPALFLPGPLFSQFLNAFHGCYKDGTGGDNGNADYRWFAGFYFLLRVVIHFIIAVSPNWFFHYLVQQLVYVMVLLTIAILQPYKRKLFNFVDATIFAILAVISGLTTYNYYLTKIDESLSSWAFAVQYILIFVPLIYISVYSMQQACRKLHKYKHYFSTSRRHLNEIVADADDNNFLDYTDNDRYRNIDNWCQKQSRSCSPSSSKSNSNEKSSLLHD